MIVQRGTRAPLVITMPSRDAESGARPQRRTRVIEEEAALVGPIGVRDDE